MVAVAAMLGVALGVVLFLPRLGGDFVADSYQLLALLDVLGRQGRTVQEALASDAYRVSLLPVYRPLAMCSLAVDYHTFGLEPVAFRLVNLALHLATATLLGAIAWCLTRSRLPTLVAVTLFTASPLSAEAVYWAATRGLLLSAMFGTCAVLGTVVAILPRPGARPGATWRAAATIAAALSLTLALLAYEAAVAFVPVLTCTAFVLGNERGLPGAGRALRRTWWAWGLLAAYLCWRRFVLGRWVGGYGAGAVAPLSLDFWRQQLDHLATAISPVHLGVFPSWVKVAWGVAVPAAVFLALVATRRAPELRTLVRLALVWLVCFMFPGLFLGVGAHDLANGRLLYVQSAGVATLIACGIGALASRPTVAYAAFLALLLSASGILSGNLGPWQEAGNHSRWLRARLAAIAAAAPDTAILVADLPFARRGAFVASGAIVLPPFGPAGRAAPIAAYIDDESDLVLHALATQSRSPLAMWRYDRDRADLVPQTLLLPRPAPLAAGGTILAMRSRGLPGGALAVDALVGEGTPDAIAVRLVRDGNVLATGTLAKGSPSVAGDVRRARFAAAGGGDGDTILEFADGTRWVRSEAITR